MRMIDAPVGRQQQHAVEGKLLIMVGGETADLERARPVLERMGDTIIHCGPVGAGSRMKIVNNFMSITLNATTAEALTLAEASGLDVELARRVMLGTVAGTGHMGTTYPAKVLKADLTPGFMVDLALKDLRLALELGESLQLPLSTGQTAEKAYVSGARGWSWPSRLDGTLRPCPRAARGRSRLIRFSPPERSHSSGEREFGSGANARRHGRSSCSTAAKGPQHHDDNNRSASPTAPGSGSPAAARRRCCCTASP